VDGTAAFEDVHAQVVGGGTQNQAQRRGRCRAGGFGMAEYEEGGVAGLGGQVQPAQGGCRWTGGPVEQGRAMPLLEDLFGRPQAIGRLCRRYPQQLPAGDAMGLPSLDGRLVGRVEQDDAALGGQLP